MDTQTTKTHNGRYFSVVRDGAPVVHTTRKYLTRRMAEASAACWIAFHGEEDNMSAVTDSEEFWAYRAGDHKKVTRSAEYVRAKIAEAERFGCDVSEGEGPAGQYIMISKNGSAYGHYFRKAA